MALSFTLFQPKVDLSANTGKDFGPTVGDFGHMASEATPIVDYIDQREDFDLEYLGTIWP